MSTYDFKALSGYDFELLVRDLLQEEISVRLENFKSGRDRGIDLRYTSVRDGSIIVQCKHYAVSGYAKLLRNLASVELPKVKHLDPKRYIVATSVGLTPSNKSAILEVLRPYCLSPGDIFGREDLNNLLNRFQNVERQHYKLWLTSTALMERLLHSRSFNQSETEVSRIQKTLLYYVQNDSFFEAQEILDKNSYCIIAGIPGIGKTTLAEILLMSYLERGYEAVKISSDVREAYDVYNGNKKQAFYYDDFLGQTSLMAKLNKNEDQELLSFIERIQSSNNSKLILTTREYILNQAKTAFERLNRSKFDVKKCVIDLHDYTRFDRAKILYNHIYFSNLPAGFKDALLNNEQYLNIVDHRNFNPRIVSYMTDHIRQLNVSPSNYVATFVSNLDNPTQLWEHAFENQLSDGGRHLLLALVSLPAVVFMSDLEQAFANLHASYIGSSVLSGSSRDFRHALKELDGTFIRIERQDDDRLVSFQNPSIRDFLVNYLSNSPGDLKVVFSSAAYYEQIEVLWNERAKRPTRSATGQQSYLMLAILECQAELTQSLTRNYLSPSCNCSQGYSSHGKPPVNRWYRKPGPVLVDRVEFAVSVRDKMKSQGIDDLIRRLVNQLIIDYRHGRGDRYKVTSLARTLEHCKYLDLDKAEFVSAVKHFFMRGLDDLYDFECLNEFETHVGSIFTDVERSGIIATFSEILPTEIDSILSDETEADVIRGTAETLRKLGNAYDIDVSVELEQIEERARDA